MSVIQINNTNIAGATILERRQYIVRVKTNWTDILWEAVPYLQPLSATVSVAPSISQAVFLWRYGNIKHEDSNTFTVYEPLSIADKFIPS